MEADTRDRVRISYTRHGTDGEVRFSGLSPEEIKKLEAVCAEVSWVRVVNGRLEFLPIHVTPPEPTEDDMLPGWRRPAPGSDAFHYQREIFEVDRPWNDQSASISIQHLCGYGYTPDGYKANVAMLEACGFHCMRSPRGDSGKFWESWFLPCLSFATGPLKVAIEGKSKEHQMRFAIKFLREQVTFGTLDLSVQRLFQVID